MSIAVKPVAIVTIAALAVAGCTHTGSQGLETNTEKGAVLGGLLGAALGASTGDNARERRRGAVIGAVAGGLIGGGIGADLDRQEADLRRDLGNSDVQITNTGDRLIVTLPQDILFATDSTHVRSDLQRDLQALSGNLMAYPNSTVQVIGHTDNEGDASYNQTLSEGRANAVRMVLLNSGVPGGRIQAFGRGEDQPIATNLTPEGRAQNRRVEIVILPNPA